MGERSIRRDGKGGAILSQALQPHFVAGALAFFFFEKGSMKMRWNREGAEGGTTDESCGRLGSSGRDAGSLN